MPSQATGTHGMADQRRRGHGPGMEQQEVEGTRFRSLAPPLIEQPFRFQGQQFDEETGLHYNRFRYYDPGVGKFISQDPIGLTGGINLFEYSRNPLFWIDPWGLDPITANTKVKVAKENAEFFGRNRCESCGVDTIPAQKSTRGVKPPPNEAQYDHIEADSKGGSNTEENVQLLCRSCNRLYSDKEKPNFKLLNRIGRFFSDLLH